MTVQEAISGIDGRKPNTFSESQKLRWLAELDWTVFREVLQTHEAPVPDFTGYPPDMTREARETTVLLAPPPYDSMYLAYLESRMDYENGEIGRYNNSLALFRSGFEAYRNWYNRTCLPKARAARFC